MEDKVAPEMLRMSLPTLSGLALVLPTNCDSQLGLRTSPPYRLAVREDIDATHPAALDRDRIVDVKVLADDMVEHENSAAARLPHAARLHLGQARGGNAAFCASATDIYWTA